MATSNIIRTGLYYIVNISTHNYAALADDRSGSTPLNAAVEKASGAVKWNVERLDNGDYKIQNVANRLYAAIDPDGSSLMGKQTYQSWKIQAAGQGNDGYWIQADEPDRMYWHLPHKQLGTNIELINDHAKEGCRWLFKLARRNMSAPSTGDLPTVILRLQIVGCLNLPAKDFNRSSDPYVIVSFPNFKDQQTPVVECNLDPTYQDATFEYPLHPPFSPELVGSIKMVVWDRDRFTRDDYLGEARFSPNDWFYDKNNNKQQPYAFEHQDNHVIDLELNLQPPTRKDGDKIPTIRVKLGFVAHPSTETLSNWDYDRIYSLLVPGHKDSIQSLFDSYLTC